MNIKWCLIVVLGAAAAFFTARGDDAVAPTTGVAGTPPSVTKPHDDVVTDDDPATTKALTDTVRAERLATEFGVPQQTVLDMRQKSRMGWGEIRISLQLARYLVTTAPATSPLSITDALQQVMALRAEGMGWGQIALKYGTTVGALKHTGFVNPSGMVRPEKPVKPEMMEKPMRPDKPEPPMKPEKPVKPDKPEQMRRVH